MDVQDELSQAARRAEGAESFCEETKSLKLHYGCDQDTVAGA